MRGENHPLVSCICLTHNRVDILKRSVQCFLDQTYTNKELIVGFNEENREAADFLASLRNPSIKPLVFQPDVRISLGEKRNRAISIASGYYFCVWDDDDWYNETRIEVQVKSLVGTAFRSSILSNIVFFDSTTNAAYVSAMRWGWEQSLLCEISLMSTPGLRYQPINRGEDSAMVYNLKHNGLLLAIACPELYIYVYHGKNVFHRGHWDVNLLPWARPLSAEISHIVQSILHGEHSSKTASAMLKQLLLM